ncbi:MAG: hypothetical protein KC636_14845 [Myxococcales bacterium]|nr:hypothetical protein [Myxococcales bacterium]
MNIETDPRDDLSALDDTVHMLQWLHPEPYRALRDWVAEALAEQVPGSELLELRAVGEPEWLTGARPGGDLERAVLVRTGVAFPFTLRVRTPKGVVHALAGVISWVGRNLDDPEQRMQQRWLDLDGTLEEFGAEGALTPRLLGVDAS